MTSRGRGASRLSRGGGRGEVERGDPTGVGNDASDEDTGVNVSYANGFVTGNGDAELVSGRCEPSKSGAKGSSGSHEVLRDGHGIDSTVTSVRRILIRRDGQSLLQSLDVEDANRAICLSA